MHGLHLTADLSGVRADLALMLDTKALQALCVDAVALVGLGTVAELFHRFTPAPGEAQSGITGVVLLAESHLAIHTWPELGGVTLDVYVCNMGRDNSAKAQALMASLISAFSPDQVQQQALQRG
ncbi:MAG: adenosylmethionine decarboxylase [Paucibacter sp.]|nr:adenosylmethionine decarboxylase [Roseateles sp.]